ncbi:MAG TPA: nucleotidyltransferase domain-containing protein [Actinomycetota bacterium]|nr:nucleotidyltransferase domain-containing protein [Actinomycetota bacterium]
MDVADRVIAAVAPHPAVRELRLVGSRAEGRATALSDWDFEVQTSDFGSIADALPGLCAPLQPLAQQWDRLSAWYCWMLMLRGPTKVDLIFPDQAHTDEPPWRPASDNLDAIDAHFWDWMLWLKSKEVAEKMDVVGVHLQKAFDHLLAPLGAERPPSSIPDAVGVYRRARGHVEERFGRRVSRALETEVVPALIDGSQGRGP